MDALINESQFLSTNVYSIFDDHIIYSITDLDGIITNVSTAFCRETGYRKKDMIGKTHAFLRAPGFPDETYTELWETITDDLTWKGQINNIRKNGDSYWINSVIQPIFNHDHKKMGYLSIRQNITKEKTCEALSFADELTGAYNRRKFNTELHTFLINYYRYDDNFSIIMIDIDHFKKFNDEYGHLVGDEVLKRVCHVIQKNIRVGDLFARWGGEEFVLLLNKIDSRQAKAACSTLLNKVRLDLPLFLFDNFGIHAPLTCSMGITSPQKSDCTDTLISRADTALYDAKNNGRNRIEVL